MEESNPGQTPAFGIAVFLFFIVFIIILNQLPFPSKYGFWHLTGICFGTCMIVSAIYTMATGLVETVFKIFVEVMAALLLFGNAVYVATCWATLNNAKLYFELDTVPTVLLLAVILCLESVGYIYPLPIIKDSRNLTYGINNLFQIITIKHFIAP